MKIDLIRQGDKWLYGPWYHLFDRPSQKAIGAQTPQDFLGLADKTDDYQEYTGPLDEADAETDA